MIYVGNFGEAAAVLKKYRAGANLVAGQVVIENDAGDGEVTDPTGVTDLANVVGVTLHGVTVSTTQGHDESTNIVQVYASPGLFKARANPGATAGTAFADADGNLLTNTTQSAAGTTITDPDVGANSKDQGTVFALDGANAGLSRIITTFNANTSIVVTDPFPNTIEVGDRFLQLPWRKGGTVSLQLTSDFTEADASAAVGTGGPVVIYDIIVSTDSPYSASSPGAWVIFRFADHVMSENT